MSWERVSFLKHSEKWTTGRESVERSDGRSGRPKDAFADENVMVVDTLVMCNRRRELRSIASEVGINLGQYNQS